MTFIHRLRVRYDECGRPGDRPQLAPSGVRGCRLRRMVAGAGRLLRGRRRSRRGHGARRATVRYLAPLRADELVEIRLRVAELGTSSLRVAMSFERSGECVATVALRHVFVDPASLRPRPVADQWREAIARYAGCACASSRPVLTGKRLDSSHLARSDILGGCPEVEAAEGVRR